MVCIGGGVVRLELTVHCTWNGIGGGIIMRCSKPDELQRWDACKHVPVQAAGTLLREAAILKCSMQDVHHGPLPFICLPLAAAPE